MFIFFSEKMGFDIFIGYAVLSFYVDLTNSWQMSHYLQTVVRCIQLQQVKGEWDKLIHV